jgi:CCR4-NOT transcriptional complex subunit CAF120
MRAPTPGGIPTTGNEPRAFSPGPGGRKSPGPGTGYTHFRKQSDDTARRVPWQPGAARVGSPSGERALSPEQFVQQRAAAASATPLYAHGHQRSVSGNTLTALRTGTPTPPLRRNGSQELLTTRGGSAPHSRSSSADLLQRPGSQGTGAVLSGAEISSHLSAREQEHVARVTGSPLINVAGNRNGPQPQAGLVGAIEAREREKAQMKHGLGGQAVAAAIDQRQREQYNQAQRAAQIAYANQMAGQQQQQNFGRPGAMSPGPGPSMYAGTSMGPGGMGMGPGPVMSPPRNNSFGPGVPPQQQRPQEMMPQQLSYGQPSPQMYGQPGPWGGPPQQRGPPMQPPPQGMPPVGMGMRGGGSRPQSPALPPPRQFSPVGSAPRPGTPGGSVPFQGQAF